MVWKDFGLTQSIGSIITHYRGVPKKNFHLYLKETE